MKGKQNDYSVSFYNGDKKRLFLEYVHDTDKALRWVATKQIQWTHANVYNRRTREFITQLKPE